MSPSSFLLPPQVLGEWDIRDRLHQVEVPTLVLMGEFDTMSEECHMQCVDGIRHAWPLVTIPRAAHCKLIDEAQLCSEQVARFLDQVEGIRRKA